MESSREDAFNVMLLTAVVVGIIVVGSMFALQSITHNFYLNSYFSLEAFFDAQNTAASTQLASMAFASSPGVLVSILVVVFVDNLSRILIVSFIIAAAMDFMNYANLEDTLNKVRARLMRGHVILCGYSRISAMLIQKLGASRISSFVVEPDKNRERLFSEEKVVGILGDFTDSAVLESAGVARASAVAFLSDNDARNIVGSITAKRLNPRVKVLVKLADEDVRKQVYGIGIDVTVVPEHLAGTELADYLLRSGVSNA